MTDNLVEVLRSRAERHGDRLALTFLVDGETPEAGVTFSELDRRARCIAAALQAAGAQGQCALVAFPEGVDYVAAFLGCLYAGSVPVPAYPPVPSRLTRVLPRLVAMVKDARATVALTTSAIAAQSDVMVQHAPELKDVRWIATDALKTSVGDWKAPSISSNGLALLQYTSGSTSLPKGVAITHANLMATFAYLKEVWVDSAEQSVGVSWLPPYHDMGLIIGILNPIFSGFPAYLMSPLAFLKKPRRWLAAMTRFKGSISPAPNFAYDLCTANIPAEGLAGLDLSSWRMAGNAAEPIRLGTIERFSRHFESVGFNRRAFSGGYGLAEATVAVCGDPWDRPVTAVYVAADKLEEGLVALVPPATPGARALVACGRPTPSAISQMVIANPETKRRCEPQRVGELWLSGPGVAQGYWRNETDTAEIFKAHLADTGEGPFLRTGDLGFILDGETFITGRLKELIIVHGRNLYPHDLEQTVQSVNPALRAGCGAAFSVDLDEEDRVVIVQELTPGDEKLNLEVLRQGIKRALADEHNVAAQVVFVKRGSVPKTSSGKIQRRECRASYLKQNLEYLVPGERGLATRMPHLTPRSVVDETVCAVWASVLGVKEIKPTDNFFNLGGDSRLVAHAVLQIGDQLGIEVPGSWLFETPTVSAFAQRCFESLCDVADSETKTKAK